MEGFRFLVTGFWLEPLARPAEPETGNEKPETTEFRRQEHPAAPNAGAELSDYAVFFVVFFA